MTSIDELAARLSQEIGVSEWRTISQQRVDGFATVTDDAQFIHVDPRRAQAETDFGGTIAHGFLTLSLLSSFCDTTLPHIVGQRLAINYGFDRIRFINPVLVGARIRARFTLVSVSARGAEEHMVRYGVTVEIENEPKPALVADWITLVRLN